MSVCQVVGDPSYFPDKVRRTSKVVRAMCLLSHPIPSTNNAPSAQIILPQRQVGQRHSHTHPVLILSLFHTLFFTVFLD